MRTQREIPVKTHGEIESAICEGISRFEQDYMGRGPKDIHTHLLVDLLVVRLQGVLTAAEQQLVKSLSADKGRDLLKQVRTHLIETARPVLESLVQEITGVKVRSMHHDISTVTGEEVVLFTLAESPDFRSSGPPAAASAPLSRWPQLRITPSVTVAARVFHKRLIGPPKWGQSSRAFLDGVK